MPVISGSALVAISALGLRYSVCAMIVSMFLGQYQKRNWWGFVPIYAGFLAWQVIVMLGADVRNPLDLYILTDYDDAARIVNIIYPVECFFFCWIGFIFHKILSNIQIWQFTEKIPYPLRSQEKPAMLVMPDGSYTVRNIVHDRNAPVRNFGIVGLTQSWWQAILTFIVFLAMITPQIVYEYYVTKTGQELMAYLVNMICTPGVIVLFAIYCYIWPDPGTFGLTKPWLLARQDIYKLQPEQIDMIDKDTKRRVLWTLLPIAAFALFGNAVLGGWRMIDPDADRMWLGMVGLWGAYALILLVILATMRSSNNPLVMPAKTTRVIDDSQGYVEQLAAPQRNDGMPDATTTIMNALPFGIGNVVQRYANSHSNDTTIEMKALSKGMASTKKHQDWW